VLIGMEVNEQKRIDKKMLELDGTENKSNLGANAILGVSMAVCRTGSISENLPLYKYISKIALTSGNKQKISRAFFNIINGGMHAGNKIAFQEFMISPNLENFEENYRAASEIYQTLKGNLKKDFGGASTLLGDEGGFAPDNFKRAEEALDKIMEAISDSGYENKVDIALDVAASEFYEDEKYNLGFKMENSNIKSSEEMINYYLELVEKYPIISIEDPFDQNDFDSFAKLLERLMDKNVQIVADDLTVTNPGRIQKAIQKKSANALLLKINQIGTITESIEAFDLAKSDNWKVMVSHRSGETTDDFIADFAIGIGAEQIKSGATARGERVCKYNRMLAIEKKEK
jgi:enolase